MRNTPIPSHRRPTTPGEILAEEFLHPLGISQTALAERIGVHYPRLNEVINGRRGVSVDTALRLSKALGTSAEFWLNLQQMVDLYDAQHDDRTAQVLEHIDPLVQAGKR